MMKHHTQDVPVMFLDESLARASLTSGVHPPHAGAIDYPLVAFFQMKSVPSDEHVQGILNKLAKFPRFRCKVEPVGEGNVLGKLLGAHGNTVSKTRDEKRRRDVDGRIRRD